MHGTPNLIQNYTSEHFSLQTYKNDGKLRIDMQMFCPKVNTFQIKGTLKFLTVNLPTIFRHKCFNNHKQSFKKEVLGTELGHLFEHVLMEYFVQTRTFKGMEILPYKGFTSWNWIKNPRGSFEINIESYPEDIEILEIAMEKTITLITLLLSSDITIPITKDDYLAPNLLNEEIGLPLQAFSE